jgi:hypothetical protein
MSKHSNFGTGGVLFAGVIGCLVASVWIGPVAFVSLAIILLTYNMLMKFVIQNFNPDGSRKGSRRRR